MHDPVQNKIRLQFDGLEIHFDRNYGRSNSTGWSVYREGTLDDGTTKILRCAVNFGTWEEVWAALTLGERVQCIDFRWVVGDLKLTVDSFLAIEYYE